MTAPATVIEVRDVTRVYRMRGGDVHALRGVTLDVFDGEYVSIMGPSGSGKSTLFNMIGGLDRPTAGLLTVDGVDLSTLDSRALAWFRCSRIGYIFQTFNLIPTLTALENCMLPCTFHMRSEQEARRRAAECLEAVGLGDRLTHRPHELSGGQMQRVAIARSLVNEPRILLADEPTGNLDLRTGEAIIDLLSRLNRDRGVTVVTVTHDHKMLSASRRIVWFNSGRIDRIQQRDELRIRMGRIEGEADNDTPTQGDDT
jgi:putative ABC transport system ATP-binding protein